MSRKVGQGEVGGTGGGGWDRGSLGRWVVHPKGANSMATSGLSRE